MPEKNVIPQNQSAGIAGDKFSAYDKGLSQSIRTGLHRIFNPDTPLASVMQLGLKQRPVLRRGNHQYIIDPGKHQRAQGIVNHGFIVNRHQLFTDRLGQRIKASP
ncbi:MAG: hypothetical protein A4E66_01854 [Syntrophus sp. PtaB.Bin001]|nr:MAG: hypothetical protein A4E66_01854 [Syntrophus sp. PtaB.Bin001]